MIHGYFVIPRERKDFKGSGMNSTVGMEENMFNRKYLVLSACVVLSLLVVTVPVAAAQSYAVSVSSYGSGPLSSSLSAGKLAALQGQTSITSPLNSYNGYGISSQKLSSLNSLQAQGGNAAMGSVSAFSSYSSRTETSSMSFSESVSVTGEIYTFEFSTIFS
jgi:hypothetical protein